MKRSLLLFAVLAASPIHSQLPTPTPQHNANFDSERSKANELFLAQKPLEALPLYEDLCRQDPKSAVFAERHGAGLLAKESTIDDANERMKVRIQAMNEIKRAKSLGDDSAYVRTILALEAKNFIGAVITGIPLTVGYTYNGKPDAQAIFRQAEAAFRKSDWSGAAPLYAQAAQLDPAWYAAALYAGDTYFRLKDLDTAGQWFARAIAVDPDRETAYRYWGDLYTQSGAQAQAREKFVDAIVA